MHQIMSGHHPDDVPNAFRAPLRVLSRALQLDGSQGSVEPQVGISHAGELRHRLVEWRVAVPEIPRERILIESGKRRIILGEDDPHSPRGHQLGVRQVLNHLDG